MMLRVRMLLMSLLLALPAALLVTYLIGQGRTADQQWALERFMASQMNAQVRERCESDPTWFLTGPLEGRPAGGVFVATSEEQLPPRPKVIPQPFELFAYDDDVIGTSPASARMPPELRRVLRFQSAPVVVAPYVTSAGTGVQVGVPTGWVKGPCAFFLGRMEAPPGQRRQRNLTFVGLYTLFALVANLALWPTVGRIRRQAGDARQAANAGYTPIAPDSLKDELSSLTFVHNDLANELQDRKRRIDDQDATLRRLVQSTEEDIAAPLASLENGLGALVSGSSAPGEGLVDQLRRAHDLAGAVENLAATARLRMAGATVAMLPVDLTALVSRVLARHAPIASATGVSLQSALPSSRMTIATDEYLLARAVANVVDNAIRYNRPGGNVFVRLELASNEPRFRLFVVDSGAGVDEEAFRGLTAIRRFRGDEGRNRRPGAPGLGLAVAREVADRLGLTLDLKRPAAGGFEVEFSGPLAESN
jgi:signal transduction histidine kinase